MWAVFVGFGRVVWHLFYCSGLKGPTSTVLFVSFPFPEACVFSAALVGSRGSGGGGVAGGGLAGVPQASGPAAVAAGEGLSGGGGTDCATVRSYGG